MKQHKVNQRPAHTGDPAKLRQEIDVYLKAITQLLDRNPQKVAAVLKAWIDAPSKINKSKRAA